MPKIEPAVRELLYLVPNGVSYIDLAKDLSAVNRRLYRQGMSYVVQDVQVGVSDGMQASDVWAASIGVIPNSWIAHNAWTKAFRVWREQQDSVTRYLPGTEGKWADFKIYLDDAMEDGTILESYAGDAGAVTRGDWDHSKFIFDDDGTERSFKMHMIGSSNFTDTNDESAIGLIHEYSHSRSNVHISSPDVETDTSDSIYAKLIGTDEMSDLLINDIEGDNDVPPYAQDEFPGGETNADAAQMVRFMSCSGNQTTVHVPGFVAPCGLIRFQVGEQALTGDPAVYAATSSVQAAVIITVAPGPYRGVLAAPMGQ